MKWELDELARENHKTVSTLKNTYTNLLMRVSKCTQKTKKACLEDMGHISDDCQIR